MRNLGPDEHRRPVARRHLKRVLLLVPQGAEVYETAAFFDVLGWARHEASLPIEVVTVGLQREVVCTFGLRLVVDALMDEIEAEDFDALALPGGFEEAGYYGDGCDSRVSELIRGFDERHRPIACICTGALPVAHSGVLEGRRATTYGRAGSRRRRQLASYGVTVEDGPVVSDANIISSTGPGTAVDVALRLVEALTSREEADRVRLLMGF